MTEPPILPSPGTPLTEAERDEIRRNLFASIRGRHPELRAALREDARFFSQQLMEERPVATRLELLYTILRLAWTTDAFLGLAIYRVRTRLLAYQVPVLPEILHRLSMLWCQLSIGRYTVIEPGVYFPHGQVVIDGLVEIGSGTVITPWVTIGLRGSVSGPKIGRGVFIGTGAKILGDVRVGVGARIGANAVVIHDVPEGATALGAPARPLTP
jgi:serine O-acetyltransferase